MEYIYSLFQTVSSFVQKIFNFLIELVTWAFASLWSVFVDAWLWLWYALPDPCCVREAVSLFTWLSHQINSGGVFQWLAWLYDLLQFEFGLRIFLCAALASFLVRRLPIIG